jgi:hypothetical protein
MQVGEEARTTQMRRMEIVERGARWRMPCVAGGLRFQRKAFGKEGTEQSWT